MANPFANIGELLAIPDYRRLWLVGAGTGIARWLEFLGVSIFAFQLTGSAPLVALMAIVRMLPYAVFGFIVGSIADFIDRKTMLALSVGLALIASAVMAALTAFGMATYALLLVLAAISGLVWTTDMPVRRRLLAEAAGPQRLPSAVGLDNSTSHATRAFGPLFGGLVYQFIGIEGIFCLTALLYAACLLVTFRLTMEASPHVSTERPSIAALLVPPAALLQDRRFRIVLGVTVVYNLWCFPFITMVPVIAQRDFLLEPAAVGALTACDGIGGMFGALLFGSIGSQRSLFRFYFIGTMTVLCCTLMLSFFLWLGAAVPLLLLMGVGAAFFSATQFALVYSMADPAMRGRATGFLSIFIGLSTVGHYMTGRLFDTFTTVDAARIISAQGIIVLLILGALWMTSTPSQKAP